MRGETESEAFRAIEPPAIKPQKLRHSARKAREITPAAHIGEQADAGLGHGEYRAFGGDAVFAGAGDAHAAAHGDAVHEDDARLAIGIHVMVHAIFLIEE